MGFDNLLKTRKSTRDFKPKKPDWRRILECVNAARFAPMAGDIYSLKFILVYDKDKIEKIAEECQQDFVAQVHYLLVACTIPSKTINAYGKRGEIYLRQQAGAAIQNVLLKLTEKKLAHCWVGHFVEDHVKHILKVPDKTRIEAVIPIGYELKKTKRKKEKIPLDNILYFNSYGNRQMKEHKKINV